MTTDSGLEINQTPNSGEVMLKPGQEGWSEVTQVPKEGFLLDRTWKPNMIARISALPRRTDGMPNFFNAALTLYRVLPDGEIDFGDEVKIVPFPEKTRELFAEICGDSVDPGDHEAALGTLLDLLAQNHELKDGLGEGMSPLKAAQLVGSIVNPEQNAALADEIMKAVVQYREKQMASVSGSDASEGSTAEALDAITTASTPIKIE